MMLLKLCVSGLPLFQGKCEIDFMAQQRVTEENAEQMARIFSSGIQDFYKNNVLSFTAVQRTTGIPVGQQVGHRPHEMPVDANRDGCRQGVRV